MTIATPSPLAHEHSCSAPVVGARISGNDGAPAGPAENRARLESEASPFCQRGHLPLVSGWMAMPIVRTTGGRPQEAAVFRPDPCPVAHRLFERCDAGRRILGASKGAGLDGLRARELGWRVGLDMSELADCREVA